MLRIALEFVRPGMELGKDLHGANGRIVLAAGVLLSDSHIEHLHKWGVASVFIKNPLLELPPIDDVVAESTRFQAVKALQSRIDDLAKRKTFSLSPETGDTVRSIISQVLSNRDSIIHLAQIHRHHDDLLAHSINVAILSTMTAVTLDINDPKDLGIIALGAMLHDIGMVFVPKHLLQKQTLSTGESETVKNHTRLGFEILRKNRDLPLLVAHIALQHHERYDGNGFPRRIAGSDINKFAYIVAIANEYDNMVADKPGKKGMETHVAYEAIVAGVNTYFHPAIARAFLSRIALYPVGTLVKLTTGDIGVVTGVTPLLQHRPVLRVIASSDRTFLTEPYTLNLAAPENLTVFISSIVSDADALAFLQMISPELEN